LSNSISIFGYALYFLNRLTAKSNVLLPGTSK